MFGFSKNIKNKAQDSMPKQNLKKNVEIAHVIHKVPACLVRIKNALDILKGDLLHVESSIHYKIVCLFQEKYFHLPMNETHTWLTTSQVHHPLSQVYRFPCPKVEIFQILSNKTENNFTSN
jgi:hypothetical protein